MHDALLIGALASQTIVHLTHQQQMTAAVPSYALGMTACLTHGQALEQGLRCHPQSLGITTLVLAMV